MVHGSFAVNGLPPAFKMRVKVFKGSWVLDKRSFRMFESLKGITVHSEHSSFDLVFIAVKPHDSVWMPDIDVILHHEFTSINNELPFTHHGKVLNQPIKNHHDAMNPRWCTILQQNNGIFIQCHYGYAIHVPWIRRSCNMNVPLVYHSYIIHIYIYIVYIWQWKTSGNCNIISPEQWCFYAILLLALPLWKSYSQIYRGHHRRAHYC